MFKGLCRKHGPRCVYDASSLPPCLSQHSLLPLDPSSGWCEYTGRRKYIEDFHSIVFSEHYKYFGVFDGHLGSRAARFASRNLHSFFDLHTQAEFISEDSDGDSNNITPNTNVEILSAMNGHRWTAVSSMIMSLNGTEILYDNISVRMITEAMLSSFASTHDNFVATSDHFETSGTTATIAVLYRDHLLVGHVGDSRSVLSLDNVLAR